MADGEGRVERRHRLLEYHADLRSADGADLCRCQAGELSRIEPDNAPGFAHSGRQEVKDSLRRERLAAAGLPDDGQALSCVRVQGEVVDKHAGLAMLRCRFEPQMIDFEQVRGLHASLRGSSQSRSASPKRLTPNKVNAMHRPGTMLSQAACSM